MAVPQRISRRVRTLREQHELSLEALAHAAGIDAEDVRSIESGTKLPTAEQFENLATAFGMTLYTFVMKSIPQTRSGNIVAPEMRMIHYGTGRNEQEAQAAKKQSKLEEMPYFDVDVPQDLTTEEVEALTNECLMLIGGPIVLLNSVLRGVATETVPRRMVDTIRLNLHEMLHARWSTFIALEVKGGTIQIGYRVSSEASER